MTTLKPLSVIKATEINFDNLRYPCAVSPIVNGIRSIIDPVNKTFQMWKGVFNLKPDYDLGGDVLYDGILQYTPEHIFWLYDLQTNQIYEERQKVIDAMNVESIGKIKKVPVSWIDSFRYVMALFDFYIEYGHAGILIRTPEHKYMIGPSEGWKQIIEIPRYRAQVVTISWVKERFSSVTVQLDGKHFHVFRGFTEEDMEYFTRYPEAIQQKFVDLVYDGHYRYYQISGEQHG